jgi:hypothetical protein
LAGRGRSASVPAACSVGKPIRQATTYVVEAQLAAQAAAPLPPETLSSGSVRIAAPFAGNTLVAILAGLGAGLRDAGATRGQ